MRKNHFRQVALSLAAAITFTSIPYFTLPNKVSAATDDKSNGEVLVLTAGNDSDDLSRSSADYSVEDSWLFEDVEVSSSDNNYLSDSPAFSSELSGASSVTKDINISLISSDTKSTEELMDIFSNMEDVIAVQPNHEVKAVSITDDEYADYQWALENNGQNSRTAGNDINVDTFWNNGITGTTNITGLKDNEPVIAIVDTGITLDHPDLKDNLWTNPYRDKLPGEHGYDFSNNDDDPYDDFGHGSHCAGIIAASSNGTGIVGVNQNAKLMALKVLNENGSAFDAEIIAAYCYIYKAQQLGVNVIAINNSWGGSYGSSEPKYESVITTCIEMVGKQGALSVFAAGNDGSDVDASPCPPASYSSDYILSVAASNENDELASFSNYGAKNVDIAAPGANILSTVNYDCFNPTIYSEEKINNVCNTFYSFNSDDVPAEFNVSEGTLSINHDCCFGLKKDNSGSLSWNVSADDSGLYVLKIPYSLAQSDTPVNLSTMINVVTDDFPEEDINFFTGSNAQLCIFNMKAGEDTASLIFKNPLTQINIRNSIKDRWIHLSQNIAPQIKTAKEGCIAIALSVNGSGNITVNLDDLGISKENVNSVEFGKYDFYDGTSMATPVVTGASGLIYSKCYSELSSLPQEEKALSLKNTLLACCRKTDSLKGKVLTGGVLDLGKAYSAEPFITEVESDGKGLFTIKGGNFMTNGAAGTLRINDKLYRVEFSNDTISLNDTTLLNNENTFTITTESGSCSYSLFTPKITKTFDKQNSNPASMEFSPDYIFSDGIKTYAYSQLNSYIYVYEKDTNCWTGYAPVSTESIFSTLSNVYTYSSTISMAPGMCFYKGKLYCLASLLSVTANGAPALVKTFVLSYNPDSCQWSYSEIPEEITDLLDVSFGIYNDSIYVAGGYNYGKKEFSTKTFTAAIDSLNFEQHTADWKASAPLPYGRCGSTLIQYNGKLYISGGLSDTKDNCNTINIFDGKEWKKSNSVITSSDDQTFQYWKNEYYYAYPSEGIYKDGLVFYSSEKYNGLGNVFTYNASTDKYESTDYFFQDSDRYTNICFTVNNDKMYLVCYNLPETDDDWGYYKASKPITVKDTNDLPDEPILPDEPVIDMVSPIDVYTGDIASAYYSYTPAEAFSLEGSVTGTGVYLPGETVTISANANPGYYAVSIKVGSKTYKGATATFKATSNQKVSVTWGKYATSVKFKKPSLTLTAGKKTTLKYTVKDATNKAVKFKSSNTKYATVTTKGVVTAKKAGIGKTVKIYIYTADGSKLKDVCKIKIKK